MFTSSSINVYILWNKVINIIIFYNILLFSYFLFTLQNNTIINRYYHEFIKNITINSLLLFDNTLNITGNLFPQWLLPETKDHLPGTVTVSFMICLSLKYNWEKVVNRCFWSSVWLWQVHPTAVGLYPYSGLCYLYPVGSCCLELKL